MEEKLLMLSNRIDVLEKKVLYLENRSSKTRECTIYYKSICKEMIIDILNKAISIGILKENADEYW